MVLQPADPARRGEEYELHSLWNAQRTARGCWSYSHHLSWQFAFLRCQTGDWCSFLDIIQCNNQIRNEFEALWAGLCSLGQHSPVAELGHVFPSWCLLCIPLLDLGSGLISGSASFNKLYCWPAAASGESLLLPGTLHTSIPAPQFHWSCSPAESTGVHREHWPGPSLWDSCPHLSLLAAQWGVAQLSPGKFDCQICPALLPLLGDILAKNPYKASLLITPCDCIWWAEATASSLHSAWTENPGHCWGPGWEGSASFWERSASVRGELSAGAGR